MSKDNVDLAIEQSREIEKLLLREKITTNRHRIEFKTLHRLDCMREALAYRYFELLNSSYELYKSNCLIAGLCLARSTQETLATLLYINIRLKRFINGKDVVGLLSSIERIHVGCSIHNKAISFKTKSFNVMEFINESDKKIKNFKSRYDLLSEYSHPNYRGTSYSYSRFPDEDMTVSYSNQYEQRFSELHDTLGTSLISFIGIHWQSAQKEYGELYEAALDLFIEKQRTGTLQKDVDKWLELNSSIESDESDSLNSFV